MTKDICLPVYITLNINISAVSSLRPAVSQSVRLYVCLRVIHSNACTVPYHQITKQQSHKLFPLLKYKIMFLGAFAKFRKVTIIFVISVRPSVRMEQFFSHWTDFN